VLSVVLLLQSGIPIAMTLSLALHLLYLTLPLRYSYSVRHLGLVGSHDRNLSVSASGVFDILALYKLDYYYYYYYYCKNDATGITKLDKETFHRESWKLIYLGS